MTTRGLILGIESSCDETAAAVVERGARTLSSVVASQIATHARYGGVVPELASREHLRAIVPVVRAALSEAGVALGDLDAIAVTAGPGLAGALLVGITYAKALAFAQELPLIAVNHLEGHIHAVLLHERSLPDDSEPDSSRHWPWSFPAGIRTFIWRRPADGSWTLQADRPHARRRRRRGLDKVAKLLGLGYPGGPWIDALARFGNPRPCPSPFRRSRPSASGRQSPAHQGCPNRAHRQPRSAFPLFFFRHQNSGSALRGTDGLREEAQARAARLFAPGTVRACRKPKKRLWPLFRSRRSIWFPAFNAPSSAT